MSPCPVLTVRETVPAVLQEVPAAVAAAV